MAFMPVGQIFATYADEGAFVAKCLCHLEDAGYAPPPRVVRAWEEGGLLRPAWGKGHTEIRRMWMNVVCHQAAGSTLAWSLATRLLESLAKDGFTPEDIAEAILVHDAHKRLGIEANEAARARGEEAQDFIYRSERAEINFLRRLGFSEKVVTLVAMAGELGKDRIFIAYGLLRLAEKVAFYVDGVINGSRITTYEKRIAALLEKFRPGGDYHGLDTVEEHRQRFDACFRPVERDIARHLGITTQEDIDNLPLALTPDFVHE